MESSSGIEKIYSQPEVYIHTLINSAAEINGHLEVIRDAGKVCYVAWAPSYSIPGFDSQSGGSSSSRKSTSIGSEQYSIKVPLQEIVSIRRCSPTSSPPFVSITVKSSSAPLSFYFHAHKSGIDTLFKHLFDLLPLLKSETEPDVFVLAQDGTRIIEKVLSTDSTNHATSSNHLPDAISWYELFHSVYRITSQIASAATAPRAESDNRVYTPILQTNKNPASPVISHATGDDGFEVVHKSETLENQASASSSPKSGTIHALRFDIKRTGQIKAHKKVTAEFWNSLLDSEGRIDQKKEHAVRKLIFFGGIEENARLLVWPYITGLFPFGSTYKEREAILADNKQLYDSLKIQWSNISPIQEENFTPYKDRKSQIEKDVIRTDRLHPYYSKDESPQLKQLHSILLSYSFLNWDLGYVQGMNDLLSPILCQLMNEELAFGCFVSDMKNTARNFRQDQKGIHEQFEQLRSLLKYLDPHFYTYLDKNDSLNLFFMYRWILVKFKREFSHEDINRLWESLWSRHKGPNFHLFIAIGILLRQRDIIVTDNYKFDDILRHIHQLGATLTVEDVIEDGLFLHSFVEKEGTPQLKELL